MAMKIIIGLGNPGKKYQFTRHNIGFRIIDGFAEKNNFSDFYLSKKFNAEISNGRIYDQEIILAKPQTFMNESGKAVKSLITNYPGPSEARNSSEGCLPITNLWVIHDDVDLPLGKIKITIGCGAAGHKGVESIIKELKTPYESLRYSTGQAKNFIRLRIGIQPKFGKPQNTEDFVLQKFTKKEEKNIKAMIEEAIEAICMILKEGIEKTMNKYN